VEGTDPTRERTSSWARRSAELGARIRDLHERNAQLSAIPGPPDLEERRSVGSTKDQVAKAKALARVANMRAFEAMKRTADMRIHAASAHDRAAQLHELLADVGHGDIREHRDRAATHRRQAHEDRAVAVRMFLSQHVDPPETGHS
jgi:regulator of sirC expression with transglutaminase-like and TPR domain